MYTFSKDVLIYSDRICFKKNINKYEIKGKTYEQLLDFYKCKFTTFECSNQFCKFLLDEQLVVEENYYYNPFVNKKTGKVERVFVQLTDTCNLKCEHCYVEGNPNNKNKLNFAKLRKFLQLSVENGITEIDFTGGEIFTHPDIWKILEWIDLQPIKTVLFTNLTLTSVEDINKISNISSIVKVVTSIDYFTPEKHNAFRHGKDAYGKTMKNIDALKKAGVNVSVNSMVMDDNHEEIVKLVRFLLEKKVNIVLDTIIAEGRMKDINFDEKHRKMNCLLCSALTHNNLKQEKDEQVEYKAYSDEVFNRNCGVGQRMIYLAANGQISLCPSLIEFCLDKRYNEVHSYEEIHKFLDGYNNLNCKYTECKKYTQCGGGCRAKAFIDVGDICEKDIESCYKFGVE